MKTANQKILLDQIIKLYVKNYKNKNHPDAVYRELNIFFSLRADNVEAKSVAASQGVTTQRILEIEHRAATRMTKLLSKYKIEGII